MQGSKPFDNLLPAFNVPDRDTSHGKKRHFPYKEEKAERYFKPRRCGDSMAPA
jgi:hypothetical protein